MRSATTMRLSMSGAFPCRWSGWLAATVKGTPRRPARAGGSGGSSLAPRRTDPRWPGALDGGGVGGEGGAGPGRLGRGGPGRPGQQVPGGEGVTGAGDVDHGGGRGRDGQGRAGGAGDRRPGG